MSSKDNLHKHVVCLILSSNDPSCIFRDFGKTYLYFTLGIISTCRGAWSTIWRNCDFCYMLWETCAKFGSYWHKNTFTFCSGELIKKKISNLQPINEKYNFKTFMRGEVAGYMKILVNPRVQVLHALWPHLMT